MVSSLDWHKRYHSDALEGYETLNLEERGAYTTLLDLMYERGGALLFHDRQLGGFFNCSPRKARALVEQLIAKGKIEVQKDGKLSNRRVRIELENSAKISRKRAENGAKGGRKSDEPNGNPNQINDATKANASDLLLYRREERESEMLDQDAIASRSSSARPVARDEWADLEAQCRDAAGWQNHPSPGLMSIGLIAGVIAEGCDLHLDVLPVIADQARRVRNPTWKYFLPAIREARDNRLAVLPAITQTGATHGQPSTHRRKPARRDVFDLLDQAIDIADQAQRRAPEGRAESVEGPPSRTSRDER